MKAGGWSSNRVAVWMHGTIRTTGMRPRSSRSMAISSPFTSWAGRRSGISLWTDFSMASDPLVRFRTSRRLEPSRARAEAPAQQPPLPPLPPRPRQRRQLETVQGGSRLPRRVLHEMIPQAPPRQHQQQVEHLAQLLDHRVRARLLWLLPPSAGAGTVWPG